MIYLGMMSFSVGLPAGRQNTGISGLCKAQVKAKVVEYTTYIGGNGDAVADAPRRRAAVFLCSMGGPAIGPLAEYSHFKFRNSDKFLYHSLHT